ncbi:MAG: hypothetical protein ACLFU7_09605 [Armatimonadota bacterium]
MTNALPLIGIVLVAIIGLVAVVVVIWLVVRGAPSEEGERPPEHEVPSEQQPPPEAERPGRDASGSVTGPHPRPRELDREARRELLLLEERLHRAVFNHSEMSPEQWAQVADELLIVHDRMPVGILIERFEQAAGASVSAPADTSKSPREIAALLNEQLSPERRMELITRLEEPLEADVYAPAPRALLTHGSGA